MRWEDFRVSDNVEDRRGGGIGLPGGAGGLGIGTMIILGLIGWVLGIDPRILIGGAERVTRAASEAKLFATEAAGRIIDSAVQIHGAAGLVRGSVIERLYRDVRALRIYEGTSEIQKLVIASQLLKD